MPMMDIFITSESKKIIVSSTYDLKVRKFFFNCFLTEKL